MEVTDGSPREIIIGVDFLEDLCNRRRRVLRNPQPYLDRIPTELNYREVAELAARSTQVLHERVRKGINPGRDIENLSDLYARRMVHNLGSIALRSGDSKTAASCLQYISAQPYREGDWSDGEFHKLRLKLEMKKTAA